MPTIDEAWVRKYFGEVDSLDPDRLRPFLSERVTLNFANNPPIEGRDTVLASLQEFYDTLISMHHRPVEIWLEQGAALMQAEVGYETRSGGSTTLPTFTVLRFDAESKVRDITFMMDPSPLYAQVEPTP